MPRILLVDAVGTGYPIDSRRDDTLRAWFDEVLPWVNMHLDAGPDMAARIQVWPSSLTGSAGFGQDWPADTRVIGFLYPFPFKDGASGMDGLASLRRDLTAELARLNAAKQAK